MPRSSRARKRRRFDWVTVFSPLPRAGEGRGRGLAVQAETSPNLNLNALSPNPSPALRERGADPSYFHYAELAGCVRSVLGLTSCHTKTQTGDNLGNRCIPRRAAPGRAGP